MTSDDENSFEGMEGRDSTQRPEALQEGRYAENLNRSCEPCRGRKIRCIQGQNAGSGKCTRCEKMRLTCVYLAPNAKRKRKRTDARVAELEKELRHLKHRIDGAEEDDRSVSPPDSGRNGSVISNPSRDQLAQRKPPVILSMNPTTWTEIDMDELDDSSEQQLLDNFIHNLLPHLPFMVFPILPSVQDMRQTRPACLAAILAASAASVSPSLAQSLAQKVDRLYAEKVSIQGEKSVDFVQALVISAVFYNPPFRFAALKFTQYAHMAANMALDLRMGKKRPSGHPSYPDRPETTDGWRAFIACYILCSSMALALRRPSMLKFSDWTEYCIGKLQMSKSQSDRELAAWGNLQHIADESATVLGFDQTRGPLDLRDTTTQASLKAFEKQLSVWKAANWLSTSDSLKIHFHYIRSAIHEICLHHDYDPDEFKPPYLMRPQPLASGATILSPVYTTSLLACAESAHASLDTFLAMDTNMHRSIPVIVYTRSFYAMVLLSKLAVSAQAQNSSIGNMIDFESLRLIDYLYKMMAALKTVAGVENFNVPATFYVIVTKLSAWYSRQSRTGREAGKMDDILEPMKYMKTAEGVLEVEASNASNTNGTPEILVRPAASSDVSQKETPASTGEVPMHDYHNPAGFPQSTQPGFQHSFVQEMSGTLPWVQQDFQHWNFGEGQDFAAFDPVFNMTNFENSAMLAFATDEQNGPDPYHMPT